VKTAHNIFYGGPTAVLREAESMRQLRHPRIVEEFGLVTHDCLNSGRRLGALVQSNCCGEELGEQVEGRKDISRIRHANLQAALAEDIENKSQAIAITPHVLAPETQIFPQCTTEE